MTVTLLRELEDSAQYGKRRQVLGSSDKPYIVAVRKSDGRWTCSCPNWINVRNKKGEDCKHITEVRRRFEGVNASVIDGALLRTVLTFKESALALKHWQTHRDKIELVLDYLDLTEDARLQECRSLHGTAKSHILALMGA
jgi:hypothetical protein